jgi:hypothetical protein
MLATVRKVRRLLRSEFLKVKGTYFHTGKPLRVNDSKSRDNQHLFERLTYLPAGLSSDAEAMEATEPRVCSGIGASSTIQPLPAYPKQAAHVYKIY